MLSARNHQRFQRRIDEQLFSSNFLSDQDTTHNQSVNVAKGNIEQVGGTRFIDQQWLVIHRRKRTPAREPRDTLPLVADE
jgi:hypothetical protein